MKKTDHSKLKREICELYLGGIYPPYICEAYNVEGNYIKKLVKKYLKYNRSSKFYINHIKNKEQ